MDVTNETLEKLERLAKECRRGSIRIHGGGPDIQFLSWDEEPFKLIGTTPAEAEYFALVQPKNILSLCAEIRALRGALEQADEIVCSAISLGECREAHTLICDALEAYRRIK